MSRAWVVIKRIGKLLGFACACIVLAVCVLMIWRVCSTGTPSELTHLTPNEKLTALYAEQGEEMYVFKQHQDTITRAEYNSGYFAIPDYAFIPEANQAQLIFRYNNSTLKALAKDKGLESVPDREGDYFDVSIVLYIGLTPENPDDNGDVNGENVKKIRCNPTENVLKEKTTLYNFYRYTFDFDTCDGDVDIAELIESDSLIAIHAQFYYNEGLDYNEKPYGALLLFDPAQNNKAIKLSSADKKALAQ